MMLSFSVGYTARDLVYQWTAGRGVNIARYQHQIVMMMIPNMMTHCSDMKLSQFDLISTPTGNETVSLNHGEWCSVSRPSAPRLARPCFNVIECQIQS